VEERALSRSVAHSKLRYTASPVLPNGPLKPSIMAILRLGAAAGCADAIAASKPKPSKAAIFATNKQLDLNHVFTLIIMSFFLNLLLIIINCSLSSFLYLR
jgi:hypothetical protein